MPTKRVLVAEDDVHLSNAIYRALRKTYGHVDLTWVSTEEGAEIELSKSSFDLVLSDFLLAGLKDGVDLWNFCQKYHPRLPFMLISGIPFGDILKRIGKGNPVPSLLPKPFSVFELSALFRGHL